MRMRELHSAIRPHIPEMGQICFRVHTAAFVLAFYSLPSYHGSSYGFPLGIAMREARSQCLEQERE